MHQIAGRATKVLGERRVPLHYPLHGSQTRKRRARPHIRLLRPRRRRQQEKHMRAEIFWQAWEPLCDWRRRHKRRMRQMDAVAAMRAPHNCAALQEAFACWRGSCVSSYAVQIFLPQVWALDDLALADMGYRIFMQSLGVSFFPALDDRDGDVWFVDSEGLLSEQAFPLLSDGDDDSQHSVLPLLAILDEHAFDEHASN